MSKFFEAFLVIWTKTFVFYPNLMPINRIKLFPTCFQIEHNSFLPDFRLKRAIQLNGLVPLVYLDWHHLKRKWNSSNKAPRKIIEKVYVRQEIITKKLILTNAIFWLLVTMKPLQILINVKLKAAKKKNCQVYRLTLDFLFRSILHLFVKKPVKSCMCLQVWYIHYIDFEKGRPLMKALVYPILVSAPLFGCFTSEL